jgi:hypothetical protein
LNGPVACNACVRVDKQGYFRSCGELLVSPWAETLECISYAQTASRCDSAMFSGPPRPTRHSEPSRLTTTLPRSEKPFFVKFSSCPPSLCSHSTRCVCKVLVVEIRSLMRHMTRVNFSMVGVVDRALPAPAHKQCRHRARPISLFQLSDGGEWRKPATPSLGLESSASVRDRPADTRSAVQDEG